METEQGALEDTHYEEETSEESVPFEEIQHENESEAYVVPEEPSKEQKQEEPKEDDLDANTENRSSFVHGLSVGLGIGCIATFVIMWITVFFTPQLPSMITYEAMLSIFIYPLIYLLTVGLIALTAGIVREYFTRKGNL
ncbi:MAG: hypothetical protein OEY22_01915 [Candidatus Bathyarchaeota archaeon]|nr:hypothetical protein [Candidatus Bathyarchaeota archaeon]